MTLRQKWKNYKYRFTPWLALNLPKRLAKKEAIATKGDNVNVKTPDPVNRTTLLKDLSSLLRQFRQPPYTCLFRGDTPQRRQEFRYCHDKNADILLESQGFGLDLRPSTITKAGRGVFVSQGTIRKGQIAALYPGTIYTSGHPILLASMQNSYIFQCSDGTHVDGKANGISGLIYRSCHGRDRIHGHLPMCDVSWQCQDFRFHVNPLNVGQIVNNRPSEDRANVAYDELRLGYHDLNIEDFIALLPNIPYESHSAQEVRLVPLIATRDIQAGEELFSTYFSLVDS